MAWMDKLRYLAAASTSRVETVTESACAGERLGNGDPVRKTATQLGR